MIFMLQIVAVQHIPPAKLLEPEHYHDFFIFFQGNCVLPASLMQPWWSAVSLNDLEVGEMNVWGMWSAKEQ